jgi:hypothetical protein
MFDSRVLSSLPAHLAGLFPFVMTEKSGIDISFLQTVRSNGQSAMGPVPCVKELRERMKGRYFRDMEIYYSRIITLRRTVNVLSLAADQSLKILLSSSPEFPSLRDYMGGPLPTEKLYYTAKEKYSGAKLLTSPDSSQSYTREDYQHLMMQTIHGSYR